MEDTQMDLVQMLAEATMKTKAKCPFDEVVPKGAKSLGAAPPHLRGMFVLLAELHKQKRRGDTKAVSDVLGRALGQHFRAALDERKRNGGGPATGFRCAKGWQVYMVEPTVVTITLVA